MAHLVLDDLVQSMVDAAEEAGGRQWEALRRSATAEFTNLAETATEIERRIIEVGTNANYVGLGSSNGHSAADYRS